MSNKEALLYLCLFIWLCFGIFGAFAYARYRFLLSKKEDDPTEYVVSRFLLLMLGGPIGLAIWFADTIAELRNKRD